MHVNVNCLCLDAHAFLAQSNMFRCIITIWLSSIFTLSSAYTLPGIISPADRIMKFSIQEDGETVQPLDTGSKCVHAYLLQVQRQGFHLQHPTYRVRFSDNPKVKAQEKAFFKHKDYEIVQRVAFDESNEQVPWVRDIPTVAFQTTASGNPVAKSILPLNSSLSPAEQVVATADGLKERYDLVRKNQMLARLVSNLVLLGRTVGFHIFLGKATQFFMFPDPYLFLIFPRYLIDGMNVVLLIIFDQYFRSDGMLTCRYVYMSYATVDGNGGYAFPPGKRSRFSKTRTDGK
jgi:hypothetical protein